MLLLLRTERFLVCFYLIIHVGNVKITRKSIQTHLVLLKALYKSVIIIIIIIINITRRYLETMLLSCHSFLGELII